ncbi:MAG: hypothetical protein K9M80_02590 [Candidatus Marinimicrobia bacterium]|nr:hypothetical protein [Candidatus Neomarinimicrobiota bacterium]
MKKCFSKISTKILVLFLITFVLSNVSQGQSITLDSWRWSKQNFEVMPAANLGHAMGSAMLTNSLEKTGLDWWKADLLSFGFGLAWEIKDAHVWYEHNGLVGGEGFSKMDLIADASGIIINRALTFAVNKIFKKKSFKNSGMNVFAVK